MTGETRFGYNLDNLSRKDQFYNLSVPTITGAGLPDPSQARLFVKNGKTITAEESIAKTLGEGADKARAIAQGTMREVRAAMGLGSGAPVPGG